MHNTIFSIIPSMNYQERKMYDRVRVSNEYQCPLIAGSMLIEIYILKGTFDVKIKDTKTFRHV